MRRGLGRAVDLAAHLARSRLASCHARLRQVSEARAGIARAAAAARRQLIDQGEITGLRCAFTTAFCRRQAEAIEVLRAVRSRIVEEGEQAARDVRRWSGCRRGLERRRCRVTQTIRRQ